MSASFVKRLREVVADGHVVQIVPCMSYLSQLLCDRSGPPKDVILAYKPNLIQLNTSTPPIDVRDTDDSIDSNMELGGNPLPAPFNESVLDHSVEEDQCRWPEHLPMRMADAILFLNEVVNLSMEKLQSDTALDVWCLVDGGIRTNIPNHNGSQTVNCQSMLENDISTSTIETKVKKASRLLLGLQPSNDCWTRSYIEAEGMCSLNEIDPIEMTRRHLEISKLPEYQMDTEVVCRYNILSSDNLSVSLELKWSQPAILPPQYHETQVVVQAAVGRKGSEAHQLWRQLCVLNSLFDLLFSCWKDKSIPHILPHLSTEDSSSPLESRLKTLIFGGKQALEAQNVNRRMSMAPVGLARESLAPHRQSMAPGFLGRKSIAQHQALKESNATERNSLSLMDALYCASSGSRESDITDGLFSLLIECKTYKELRNALDITFIELQNAHRPYVRPKNNTRMAKIINNFLCGNLDSMPDFLEMEGSLYPLELLIELGLEKLTTDYCHVFLDSQLAGRNELQTPELVRPSLGTPKEKWLASCGELLGWLAQVHCALELILPLEGPLEGKCVPYMATKALKFFQSETSPVRSVSSLLLPGNDLQKICLPVKPDIVRHHTQRSFDWWRMTLLSKSHRKEVKHVFLRSHLKPIFPPQLYQNVESVVPSEGSENLRYHCASMVKISNRF